MSNTDQTNTCFCHILDVYSRFIHSFTLKFLGSTFCIRICIVFVAVSQKISVCLKSIFLAMRASTLINYVNCVTFLLNKAPLLTKKAFKLSVLPRFPPVSCVYYYMTLNNNLSVFFKHTYIKISILNIFSFNSVYYHDLH